MQDEERVVAVGLLRRSDLDRLGPSFTHLYAIDERPCFSELLRAIDVADREHRTSREEAAVTRPSKSGR